MRWAAVVGALWIAGCGATSTRTVGSRTPSPTASVVPTFAQPASPEAAWDPACGPVEVPPASPGRYPGPCQISWLDSNALYSNYQMAELFRYDDAGHMTQDLRAHSEESWRYDDEGREISHEELSGNPPFPIGHTWTYDDAGLLVAEGWYSDTDGTDRTYSYDDAGHLYGADTRDSRGWRHDAFATDSAGSVIHAEHFDYDGGLTGIEDWTYDASEHPLTHFSGAPARYPATADEETWTYDEAGEELSHDELSAGVLRESTTYSYEDGRLVGEASGDDAEAWRYCPNGLLREHKHRTRGHVDFDTSFVYGPLGLWTARYELGSSTPPLERTYDVDGNVLEEIDHRGTAPDGGPLVKTYDYACFTP